MPTKTQHNLMVRPPVIAVMGHIDHGKSTLLDYIRKANVVAGEAGGITQHMGAYQVEHVSAEGKKTPLTFLDTPGHAAFCGIRERSAQVADIAILIVSAEDGVKPQTTEAYNVIKSSKIPFVVAITKIDKPNADIDRTKQSLGEHEIYVEGWGGDVPCVAISSVSGAGSDPRLPAWSTHT
jgi:translation initiation factor IF-2